jgi:hypothetical protein
MMVSTRRRGSGGELASRFAFLLHLLVPPFCLAMASSSSSTAQKTFELANEVRPLDPADEIFLYDAEKQKELVKQAPWKTE